MVLSLESSVSSFPFKNAKINFKICVYLLLSINLQLNILQEGEKQSEVIRGQVTWENTCQWERVNKRVMEETT
jgi:hypothetical protein